MTIPEHHIKNPRRCENLQVQTLEPGELYQFVPDQVYFDIPKNGMSLVYHNPCLMLLTEDGQDFATLDEGAVFAVLEVNNNTAKIITAGSNNSVMGTVRLYPGILQYLQLFKG